MWDLRFWRWPQQRRDAANQGEWDDYSEWTDGMIARGWHHWAYVPPPPALHGAPIEMSRREWPMIRIGVPRDVPPETNINGLWWRGCGGVEIDDAGAILKLEEVRIGRMRQHQIVAASHKAW